MADGSPQSRGSTPAAGPLRRAVEEDHVPAVSSPLNPDASKSRPPGAKQREQREKKETLKKREATGGGRAATPDSKSKQKSAPAAVSPIRWINTPEPRLSNYETPKDLVFASREPAPLLLPDGKTELRRGVDIAWNKKIYRYTPAIADPHFPHKQYYRQTENKPFGPRLGFEDSDRWFHFDSTATIVTNEKGWRMGRGNVVAREGRLYYEVKVVKGVPSEGPVIPTGQENVPQPHIRMGFARREAPLDAPVGYDAYSYGVTDIRFESVHRSRPGKIYNPIPKGKKGVKNKSMIGNTAVELVPEDNVREGDVIGLEINLPSLSLHQKVVSGIYNPAVDTGDGFNETEIETGAMDIIRDRIPVPFKNGAIFEQVEYHSTKHMDSYSDRGPVPKIVASPNQNEPSLRSLPHSSIRIFKNGKLVGTAFENLMAFLPLASAPLTTYGGGRVGNDDGMLGYFPAVAAFCGGIAQVNFGPDFWFPPPDLVSQDVEMGGNDAASKAAPNRLRPFSDRYREQIAEDIVWDIIDEVDFFVQDGCQWPPLETQNGSSKTVAPKTTGLKVENEDDGSFMGRY